MSSFTTRVELHSAAHDDYNNLHAYMEAAGFSRLIKSDDGTWYHLPTAEYNREGALTIADVRASAQQAAARTGKTFCVLVSETTSRSWVGLPAYQPAMRR
jgi:hypothetical protein